MPILDPRTNPYRPDLAAKHLQGQVDARHFVEGVRHQVIEPIADLRREPAHEAALDTQALFGDIVTVYETSDEGWCWGQLESDGYVGYLSANALGPVGEAPTHRVSVPRTFGFPGADIKLPPMIALPMGAALPIVRETGRFALNGYGWHFPATHLMPLAAKQPDFVSVAESLLGAPYLWGGKSSLGIDCSGLVQISLQAAGVPCPRDTYMQEQTLGKPSPLSDLKRGDLIFWKGHVAVARDAKTIIHANGHHMMVAIEPAADAIARIKAAGSDVTSVKRI
jgi:cell wall-associated NlpC family hydrolase